MKSGGQIDGQMSSQSTMALDVVFELQTYEASMNFMSCGNQRHMGYFDQWSISGFLDIRFYLS
jgi:hypothetical protein